MASITQRIERAEAEFESDEADQLADAIVTARAAGALFSPPVPTETKEELERRARRAGLEGRIGRARLAAGVYVNSPAEQARAERERIAAESQADAEAEAGLEELV